MKADRKGISLPAVNCNNCRKNTGVGSIGNHWICEDCQITRVAAKRE